MSKPIYNLFLVVASISLYFSVISPLYVGATSSFLPEEGVSTLMQKNKDLDQALNQAKDLSSQAEKLKNKYDSIDPDLRNKLNVMVPESVDPVRLVNEVNTIANISGFNLDKISYIQNDTTLLGDGVKSYTINISVLGNYANFKNLIKQFESSLRIYVIKSVNFSIPENIADPITFSVKLETYYLK